VSLKPNSCYIVPEDTAKVAQAIFPDGSVYLRIYDTFGTLFQDDDFAALFPQDGQPAEAPFRLMLVLILQFLENLTDRQAADAVRTRIDWKYLLCLKLTDAGFHYSVLSEFRTRLIQGKAEQVLFEKLLNILREKDFLKGQRQQRTDSTLVLGAIRAINRLELVGETMRRVLNTLAVAAPDWMRGNSLPGWIDRYGNRIEDARLPNSAAGREALASQIGADGLTLLNSLLGHTAPDWLRELPVVKIFWRVWIQNYTWQEDERLRLRQDGEIPPSAIFISSPYDVEAHYSKKRSTAWIGYKVHLTETCTDDAPHLITHVETTPSTTQDSDLTLEIQKRLQNKNLLPQTHLVDLGYIDAGILAASQDEFKMDLVGPAKGDYRWQARAGEGFAAENFQIDWQRQIAICPGNKESSSWTTARDGRKLEVIKIKFSRKDCAPCPLRPKCTHAEKSPRRTITLRAERQYQAQQLARVREKTPAFKKLYARRAGVEGTISQGVRSFDLRRSRYIGMAKTHLQHLLIAIAMNLVRVVRWFSGEKLATTRQSAFVMLHQPV
jgi:transposase